MEIVMPKMGESVNEGTIIKWHKKPGDVVKRDEIIFEISTDKVDTEIPSPVEGTLKDIIVQEGETVLVGTVVANISESGVSETGNIKKSEEKPLLKSETLVSEVENNDEQKIKVSSVSSSSGQDLIDIAMPKMGESVMDGTIIKWYKKVGDKIKKDETIFEISTDKVDTEVPSPVEGTLSEILVGEQETVDVGTVVARISSTESLPKTSAEKSIHQPKAAVQTPSMKSSGDGIYGDTGSMEDNFKNASKSVNEESMNENAGFLSPLVLNIAQKENVSFDELKRIRGTGLENRITKKDILSYIENRSAGKVQQKTPIDNEQPVAQKSIMQQVQETESSFLDSAVKSKQASSADVDVIPMDNVRQKVMQHMVNSRDTSVHVTAMIEVDMSRIYNFIKNNKDSYQVKEGIKLTYMPFISSAVVKALKEYPLVNSTIEGTNILQKKYINLGIAVAMEPNGLIVPNIKAAGDKNMIGLAKSIADLANKARTRKLTPDDIMHGTFTITNYGVFGTVFGTPIINQPEVAILGVGTVTKKPVVIEVDGSDTIAIKPIMALTLAHDHRLIDGMLGGKFLKFIKDTLESFDPVSL